MTLRYFSDGQVSVIHDDSNGGADRYLEQGFTEYPDAKSLPDCRKPSASISKSDFKAKLGDRWPHVKSRIHQDPELEEDFLLIDRLSRSSELVARIAKACKFSYGDIDDLFRVD